MIKKLETVIWDREFSIPVEYDCYNDETVTRTQKKALKEFMNHPEWLIGAKQAVEEFCHDKVMLDEENDKKDNIFSYVKPDYVYVKRDEDNPKVALMCRYRYDPEHGLAVCFTSDGTVTVGLQDIVL